MTQITLRKFSKAGCVPCKMLAMLLEANTSEIKATGTAIIEHDIVAEPELIYKYGLSSVPVTVIERDGVEQARINGMCGIEELLGAIEFAKGER